MKNTILALTIIISAHAYAKKPALLSAFDVLIAENQDVVLKVKAEQDRIFPFRPDIVNAQIQFSFNQKPFAVVRTDSDGFAKLRFNSSQLHAGIHAVDVELKDDRDFYASNQKIQLTIWPVDQKIIVTDIDQTISDVESSNVILRPINRQPPFIGSQQALIKFKELGFKIVYLTAREDALFQLTKEWLRFHNFPAGHLIMWDVDLLYRRTPWNHGDYKTAALKILKDKFPFIEAGFGDKPHDILAYEQNSIPAYLVRSRHNRDISFPIETREFEDWQLVWDILQ